MKFEITTLEGESAGSVDVDDAIFGLEPRADLIHRYVRWQLARRQSGTRKTKGRSEIARTRRKIYKQKGTGSARHGAASAPQFRGGGKAFGPVVRDHSHDLPKKVRALALRHALSAKAKDGAIVILDKAVAPEAKTKALRGQFGKLGFNNVLVVDGSELDVNFGLAARNIPNVDVLPVEGINVYDILRREKLVLTRAAVDALEARFK